MSNERQAAFGELWKQKRELEAWLDGHGWRWHPMISIWLDRVLGMLDNE